ncbi:hypothetical protein GVN21_03115 [Caulobacter sp. SLTY]|uniref:hypothetical protein n=1 Tax=Caulobacter sp. SLTY TaxID=2683262 RepID=UPI001412C260|nr:hypothetical protein [Caulobacter sp. SLTY]NBB14345.1 hypothetical protein [Caulobacter sp. SLTY]
MIKHFGRIAAMSALALPLWGCLVMPYEPPTSGAMADIRIDNQSGRYVAVSFYDDSVECRERHNLMPVVGSGQVRDLKMVAGTEATITLSQDTSLNSGCIGTFSFTPIENHRYQIAFSRTCVATILDVTAQPAVPVNYEDRIWKRAFDEHGPFCERRG